MRIYLILNLDPQARACVSLLTTTSSFFVSTYADDQQTYQPEEKTAQRLSVCLCRQQ